MSEIEKSNFLSLAKGSWQRGILRDFLRYGTITNPMRELRGNARGYFTKYQTSFFSLLARVEKDGYNISIQRGKHGGMWGSTFTLLV